MNLGVCSSRMSDSASASLLHSPPHTTLGKSLLFCSDGETPLRQKKHINRLNECMKLELWVFELPMINPGIHCLASEFELHKETCTGRKINGSRHF